MMLHDPCSLKKKKPPKKLASGESPKGIEVGPLLTGVIGRPFDFAPRMAAAGRYFMNRDTFIDKDLKYKFRQPKYKFIHPKYKFRHPKYSSVSSFTQSVGLYGFFTFCSNTIHSKNLGSWKYWTFGKVTFLEFWNIPIFKKCVFPYSE